MKGTKGANKSPDLTSSVRGSQKLVAETDASSMSLPVMHLSNGDLEEFLIRMRSADMQQSIKEIISDVQITEEPEVMIAADN